MMVVVTAQSYISDGCRISTTLQYLLMVSEPMQPYILMVVGLAQPFILMVDQ